MSRADEGFRFPIGTRFKTRGKGSRECVVTDQWTTKNAAGDIVSRRYVATYDLMGQCVEMREVCDTTIAMGFIE